MRRLRAALSSSGRVRSVGGHRVDDPFDACDRLLLAACGQLACGLRELCGQFVDHRRQAAHLAHLADLVLEVIEIEALARLELFGELDGLFFVDAFLRILDQRQHVAHAEDSRSHALRVEGFEAGQFFAYPRVLDRSASDVTNRQGGTPARVTIKLGQHDPGQGQGLAEGAGGIDRILTQHRINDEQSLDRPDRRVYVGDFLHHRGIDGQAASGVHQQDIVVVSSGPIDRTARDIDRFLGGCGRKEIGPRLRGDGFQLLDGRRAVDVAGHHQDLFPLRLTQHLGELADGGGLARTLQAGHQDDCRRLCRQIQSAVGVAHQSGEFTVNDTDQSLSRAQRSDHLFADGFFLDGGDQFLDCRQGYVRLQQGQANLAQGIGDVGFGQACFTAQCLHDAGKALGQVVEHLDSGLV
jgi:hypothetical protein